MSTVQPCPTARLVLLVGASLHVECELTRTLAREGLRCLWLRSVTQALDLARLALVDAVVLDSAEVDGGSGRVLAQVRQRLRCPVIVVAPYADDIDEIMALELGADVFLVQPLAPRRLRAHLMALLRPRALAAVPAPPAERSDCAPATRPAESRDAPLAGWALDTSSGSLTGRGRRVDLTVVQSALMQCLADAAGRVVSPSQLTAALPRGPQLAAHSVYVYIARLRKRLLEEGVHELRVDAVRGRGFVLRTAAAGPRDATPMMQAA